MVSPNPLLSFPAKAGNPVRRGFSVPLAVSGVLDRPLSRAMTVSVLQGRATNSGHPYGRTTV
ncbi:hypothetical protein ABIB87_006718 [Bradyrhizobium sp. JR18.2]